MRKQVIILTALSGVILLVGFLLVEMGTKFFRPVTLTSLQEEYHFDKWLPLHIADKDYYKGVYLQNDIYQGQAAFDAGDYKLASFLLEQAQSATSGHRFDLLLYNAYAYLHQGNTHQAKMLLQQIVDHPDQPLHSSEALWFITLIQLQEGKTSSSTATLLQLHALTPAPVHSEWAGDVVVLRQKLKKIASSPPLKKS